LRFKLPAVSTIRKWMSRFQVNEGFCPNLLKLLAIRCKGLEAEDRVCNLMVDEISLKKGIEYNATLDVLMGVRTDLHGKYFYPSCALVFLVAGRKRKWKQSVSFFFVENAMSASEVMQMTLECIDRLEEIGLRVAVLSSDQGSNFCSMLTQLKVSKDNPFFMRGDKKVFAIADMPHVLKSIRNCLLKNTIVTSADSAQWRHIEEFYRKDKQMKLRLCPKLSDRHFNMAVFGAKMKVKYASQVLSGSVAAGLVTYAALGQLPKEAEDTAAFCRRVNDIFDVLNSSVRKGITTYQSALTVDSSLLNYLDEAATWIKSWKVIGPKDDNITGRFCFIDGLLMNIASVKLIVVELTATHGFKYLCTRRLCTDPIENYFCIIRSKGGFSSNPTCLAFSQAFKQTISN
jgi:hypothetical protein